MWKNKLKKIINQRPIDSHKGDFGRVLVVGGSSGMTGAVILAARGALRCGAGLIYAAVPAPLVNVVDAAVPELIVRPFSKMFTLDPQVLLVGPGLSVTSTARKIFAQLLSNLDKFKNLKALVIDADGLNLLAEQPAFFAKIRIPLILTPHPGEMRRLTEEKIGRIQSHRQTIADSYAKKNNCTVVLKGAQSIVASPAGAPYINNTGNPGMATAGSGDVLAGMLAAFLGQELSSFEAACASVFVHGLAGDMAAREKTQAGMIASDIVEKITNALYQFTK